MKLERVFLMMLIEKLSLEQVEYKPFKEICEYIRGITYNKSQEAKEENEYLCPWCKSGHLVVRKSEADGKSFYGCSNRFFRVQSV